jgi:hypothetical protein
MADLNLGMLGNSFSGMFSNVGGFLQTAMISIIGIFIIGVFGFFGYKWWKDLTFYNTPVTLTRLMENGMEKTNYNLRGGIFWNKGIKDFKIKIPKVRKPYILGYIPDFSKSTATDGRVHFITSGDAMDWQQVENRWELKEQKEIGDKVFEYDLVNKPVPRETKQVTVNSIKNWRETIDKSKLTAFSIAIGAFIIMTIAHLVSLYIQTKIKCGTP